MKNILIINGHPNNDSLSFALADAYKKGAEAMGANVQNITISQLNFNSNLSKGYKQRTELEPDLLDAWEKIKWAQHLVWVHPVWWGGLPAITKGFIDRLFLPGMAFKYKPNSLFWDKLLKDKTARIITTMDQPSWYYHWVYKQPSINQLKKTVLEFCGISPVRVTAFGPIKTSTKKQQAKWLSKVELLGKKLK